MIFTSLGSSLNSLISKPVRDQIIRRNSNASTFESAMGLPSDPTESAAVEAIAGVSTESRGLARDGSSVG